MPSNILEVFWAFEYYHWFTLRCLMEFGISLWDILAFIESFRYIKKRFEKQSHSGIILSGENALFQGQNDTAKNSIFHVLFIMMTYVKYIAF